MGLLTLQEDRPTPRSVYNWRLYTCAAIAAFASVMIGYDSAFIGGTLALSSFKSEFGFDKLSTSKLNLESANIVSTYQAGCFFGAFFGYPLGQLLGRKRGLAIASFTFLLGAGVMLAANHKRGLAPLYGGRVVAGFGVGMASNLTPIYNAEISPPAIRGRLVGIYELGWQIGGLVGFWINYAVNRTMPSGHSQWLVPFAVQLIPGGLLFLGSLWIPESPRWLIDNDRQEEAAKNLSYLRQLPADDPYMVYELTAMEEAHREGVEKVGKSFWSPFREIFGSKKLTYRLILGVSLFAWQNATGINAINYYSPTVFKSIGVTGTNASLFSTGIFGVIKTTVTIVWILYLIDHLGRRLLLMGGGFFGGIFMLAVGIYIATAKPAQHPVPAGQSISKSGIAGMLFFYLWTTAYSPTWNGTPWIYNTEIFDNHIRTLTQAFAAASNWLFNFLIARFTPQMFTKMGYGVYIFFGTLMLFSVPYVYFLLPETKGIPLEDTDALFEKGLKPWKAHKVVLERIQARNGDARRIGHEDESISDLAEDAKGVEVRKEAV